MEYINHERNVVEKIKVVYAKKQRTLPPIESVFEDQVSEASFFWISTFYEIMTDENERLKDKTRHFRHRFMFQVSSMLYYYSLFKRELLMKEDSKNRQKEVDRRQIEKILIDDYAEPRAITQMLESINTSTKLEEKYNIEEIEELISQINEPVIKANRIPNIMAIRVSDKIYYFHKYRFILMFFYQQRKEANRLKEYFIKKWAESSRSIPTAEKKFEESIRDNISQLFSVLLNRSIPDIFSHQNPQDELKPDEISVKNEILINSDLTDGKKTKEDYNLFVRSVFNKKNISQLSPLHLLLGLKLKEIKREAFKHRARTVPFYKIVFSWLFNLLDALFSRRGIKEDMKNAVEEAQRKKDPLKELSDLTEVFKAKEGITPGQLDYLRKKIYEAKREIREGLRVAKKEEEIAEEEHLQIKKQEVKKTKDYFLQGKTIEEKLEEYSEKCFVKLEPAKTNSEEAVKGAIFAHFRKRKGRKANSVISIKSYGNAIVENNAEIFSQIKDKEALKKYIEVLLLGVFLRALRR